jgi:hypothetical protein
MNTPSWLGAWNALCDKRSRGGYVALTSAERIWLDVRSLIDSVENGGLISYYYNSGADRLPECMAALDHLGAIDIRRQVERVNALFPGGVPPSLNARNDVIDSWDDDNERIDALLTEVDEALMPMLEELEVKLEDFLRRSGLVT